MIDRPACRRQLGHAVAAILLAGLAASSASASVLEVVKTCRLMSTDAGAATGRLRIDAKEPTFYTGPDFNVGDIEPFALDFRIPGNRATVKGSVHRIVVLVELFDGTERVCSTRAPLHYDSDGYRFEADLQGNAIGEAVLRVVIQLALREADRETHDRPEALPNFRHPTAPVTRKVEEPLTWKLVTPATTVSHGDDAVAELWVTVRTTSRTTFSNYTRIIANGVTFPAEVLVLPGAKSTGARYEKRIVTAARRHASGCPYSPPHRAEIYGFVAWAEAWVRTGKRTDFPGQDFRSLFYRGAKVTESGLRPDCAPGTEYSSAACDCLPVETAILPPEYTAELLEVVGPGVDLFTPPGVDHLTRSGGVPPPGGARGTAELEVIKTGPDRAERGQTITYTLTVINHGPDASGPVRLHDTLPPGVELVSATGGCSFTPGAGGGVVDCRLDLPDLGTEHRDIQVRIADEAEGTLVNAATVEGDLDDPDPTNNRARLETEVSASPPPPEERCALEIEPGDYDGDQGCGCGQSTVSCGTVSEVDLDSPGCDLTCMEAGDRADCGNDNLIFGQPDHTCDIRFANGRISLSCTNPGGGACEETFERQP